MTDNRKTEEAAQVRRKSEFLKCVEDFASYIQKEYIDDGEGRSLLISACDRNLDGLDGKGGMTHVMLGERWMITASLASMMQQEGFGDIVRAARVVSAGDDVDMGVAIRDKRRRLRVDYGIAAVLGAWTLCLAAMGIAGMMHWAIALSCLALNGFAGLSLWRDIRPLRRQVSRLEASRREEREARLRRGLEAMASLFAALRQRLNDDDGED